MTSTAPAAAAAPAPETGGGSGVLNKILSPIEGIGEGVLDTVATGGHVARAVGNYVHPGLGDAIAPKSATDFLEKAATPDNTVQSIGKGLESVAEFMMGDAALKGLTQAEKAAKVATAMTKIEKSPTMTRVMIKAAKTGLATGARQGAVGAAQGIAHTGDLGEGAKEGLVAAVTGGALEGVGSAASDTYKAVKPSSIVVDGVKIPKLASQAEGASDLASGSTAANTPEFADAQQAGAQKVYISTAKRAVQQAADRANKLRGIAAPPIQDTGRLLTAGADAKPASFELSMGEPPQAPETAPQPYAKPLANDIGTLPADQVAGAKPLELEPGEDPRYSDDRSEFMARNYHYLTGTKPGAATAEASLAGPGVLRTSSPEMAQHFLSRLDEMDHSGTLPDYAREGRDALRQQLDMHYMGTTGKFMDGARMAQHVTTFGDAADQLRNHAQPIYDQLDKLSGGRFQLLKNMHEEGQLAVREASSDAAAAEAHAQVNSANRQMDTLFDKYAPQGAGRGDWRAAQGLWHDASTLDRVHNTTEGMFNGVSPETAADIKKLGQGGPARILDKPSTDRLGRLERAEGLPRLKQLLGSDGMANLQTVNGLLKTPAKRAVWELAGHSAAHYAGRGGAGALLGAAGAELTGQSPYKGAAAGVIAGVGGRAVLRSMATNGSVAQLMEYAARNQVPAKIAAPLIAAAMTKASRTDAAVSTGTSEGNEGAPPQ